MTTPVLSNPDRHSHRFEILDALRFVLAFWVAVGHYGIFPLFAGVDESTRFGRFLVHGWSSIVFGTPAVIVFFVISGFCIHLPFLGRDRLPIGRFYLRRYTRILIPVVAALLVYRLFGTRFVFLGEHSILWESPLWSLLCEEIYYAAYPLLRFLRNRFGWTPLLAVAFLAGIAVASFHPHAVSWHIFGPLGTAAILLPIWLLGALLAEQSSSLAPSTSVPRIWFWRFAAWFGSWLSEMLHFKAGISYTLTMVAFGVLAYLWVKRELAFSLHRSPNAYLAAAGAWSYSLYLVHQPGMAFFDRLPIPHLGYFLSWTFAMASALAFSYVFYLLIERPSHRLARRVRLSSPRAAAPHAAPPALQVSEP